MSNADAPRAAGETRTVPVLCRLLRAKTGYGTTEGGDDPWLLMDSSTATFRCLHTMEPFGPDGGYVHADQCGPGRSCYVAADAA